MASWSGNNHDLDEICTFTVLDGVGVRIGEKYKAPKLNDSPVVLANVNLSQFDYEFDLERKVVSAFEAHKQLEADKLEQQKDKAAVAKVEGVQSCDVIQNEKSPGSIASSSTNNDKDTSQPMTANVDAPPTILKPTKLYGHPALFDESYTKMPGSINISEFEDNNATPFELVEMQSINEFDELMSVLQPGTTIASNQSAANQRVDNNPEMDSNSPTLNQHHSSPTNNQSSAAYSTDNVLLDFNDTAPACQIAPHSLPVYTAVTDVTFNAYDGSTGEAQSPLVSKNSKSLPDLASLDRDVKLPNDTLTDNTWTFHADREATQSSDGELQERRLSAGSRRQTLGYGAENAGIHGNPERGNDQPYFATNRINNIMNQYRFTRLHHDTAAFVRASHENNPVTTDDELPPWNRAQVLPPLQPAPSSDTTRPSSRDPRPSWDLDSVPYVSSSQPMSTESIQINSTNGQFQVSFCKQPSPLPPISPRDQSQRSPSTSGSQDDSGYKLLSPEEQSFATNLASMGFPLQRVVRAVSHHGCNDKEIVDYLLVVQQLVDNGHDELDVESIVLEVKNNQDEAIAYLQTLCKLTDLGFSNQNVLKALKSTKGDSDAALEMLMS